MTGTEVIVGATTAVIVQGIQAWMQVARMSGMDETQINELFQATLIKFNSYDPSKLPDAKEGE